MVKASVVLAVQADDFEPGGKGFESIVSLLAQDFPASGREFLICQSGLSEAVLKEIRLRFPSARILQGGDEGYYRLKNLGIAAAAGEIIALADGDCVYPPSWLSSLAANIESGADVSIGFCALEGDSLWRRVCGFYDVQQMLLRFSANMRRFDSNNVGFRAELIRRGPYDARFNRTGGCVELAERLVQSGARMVFCQQQANRHRYYGWQRHSWIQAVCGGHDLIHTRQLNQTLPLAGFLRLKLLSPPLLSALLFLGDLYNLVQNRQLLGIRAYEMPAFVVAMALLRPIEMIGMYWRLLRPAGSQAFVDKHFA